MFFNDIKFRQSCEAHTGELLHKIVFVLWLRILDVLSLDDGPDTGLFSGYVVISVPTAIEYFFLQIVT
jgi:hypothetical protein